MVWLLALRRPRPHLVLVAGCVSVILVLLAAGTAAAAAPASAGRAAVVALTVPSPGDVSYAMVRVRLDPGQRLTMPAGLAGALSIFSSRLGGLAIRARAAKWRALRATTRVYVVVSNAQGGPADERDVALFVVRRNGRGGGSGARVVFSMGNARAVVGSFWVHGVDRNGYADVFHARNIFSTALANWSRYTLALKLAGAVKAALHPRVRSVRPVVPAAITTASVTRAGGRARNLGPWTGGQRPDAHVKAIYSLLFGALHNPTAWGAFKGSAAVPSFIASELHNPSLANRWRTVVAKVPVTVPDQYAALAQEEKRFTHVSAPRLGRLVVEVADSVNSSTATESDAKTVPAQVLTVNNPDSTHQYGGAVGVANTSGTASDPKLFIQWCDVSVCTFTYPAKVNQTLNIVAAPGAGAASLSMDCPGTGTFDSCAMALTGATKTAVTEHFAQSAELAINLTPAGRVSTDDLRFVCVSASTCDQQLAVGSTITFTALPFTRNPSLMTGCDWSSGASCTVTIKGPTTVNAYLNYTLATGVQAAPGSGGTVSSASDPIQCGEVASGVTPSCSASIEAGRTVVLTANPDPRSTFSSWTGCPQSSGTTCTISMNQAVTVGANFALTPQPSPPANHPLSVSVTTNPFAPTHTGYVTSSPAGIECGAVPTGDTSLCNASFDSGTTVTLTATINQGAFELWTGCDTMSYLTCTVLMGQAKNVTAQFG
jgi:hypothetical protein